MNTCQAAGCSNTFAPRNAGTSREKKYCSNKCAMRECNRRKYQPRAVEVRCCETCTSPFESRNRGRKYCSKKCAPGYKNGLQRERGRRLKWKDCAICGIRFCRRGGSTTVCSDGCRAEQLRRKKQQPEKPCVICGASFRPRNSLGLCCSQVCSWEHRLRSTRARWKSKPKPVKTCPTCQATFERAKVRYCSPACRPKPKPKPKPKEHRDCARCGTSFEASSVQNVYCSKDCYAFMKKRRRKKRLRKHALALLVRDGKKCGICHGEFSEDDLMNQRFHVDHIRPKSKGGSHDLENLQLAHVSCNIKKHNRSNDYVAPKVRPQLGLFDWDCSKQSVLGLIEESEIARVDSVLKRGMMPCASS